MDQYHQLLEQIKPYENAQIEERDEESDNEGESDKKGEKEEGGEKGGQNYQTKMLGYLDHF